MKKLGKIEIIVGPMYAGKTEELIRRVKRTIFAKQQHGVFKHSFDDRYSSSAIITHYGQKTECISTPTFEILKEKIEKNLNKYDVIAIDEVQFFSQDIIEFIKHLANIGKRVILAGLDMDYTGAPFGPMPQLLAIADEVLKLKAVCSVCGEDAMFSKRISNEDQTIVIAAADKYIAVCRKHFN